jgi:hypothetical protein
MTISWQQCLSGQDQVIARWQALAGGMSAKTWDWRLGHTWQCAVPGVAVAHTGQLTARQQAWVGVLHAGQGAALSGDAALRLRGLSGSGARDLRIGPTLDVAIPDQRRAVGAPLAGAPRIVCHRVANLTLWHCSVEGLPTVNVHAAVLHAASWAVSDRVAEWRLAAVVQQGLSSPAMIRRRLQQMPRLPWRRLIRAVLDDVELGAHAGSELEFLRFCRTHCLPLPDQLQLRVRAAGTKYVDAHYRWQKLSFEIDGAHHRSAGQREADQLHTLELAVARRGSGNQVIRLSPGVLRHDAGRTAELMRLLLCP